MTTSVQDAVREYLARGWAVVPVPRGEKGPREAQWTEREFGPDDFQADDNIGIKCGAPSGGLVDVDLDAPEAIAAADALLPMTEAVHGRPGKPRSHRWYRVETPPARSAAFKTGDGQMLVELRSTRAQTIAPPSVHPSGETLEWETAREPAAVDVEGLRLAVRLVATAALLARAWPAGGGRHALALAVGGFLAARDLEPDTVARTVATIARLAGDEEVADRERAARETADKVSRGERVTGGPTLGEALGAVVLKRLRQFWGVEAEEEINEELHRLSERFAIVQVAKSVVVVDERADDPTLLPFAEFRKLLVKRNVYLNEKRRNIADVWLESPLGRQLEGLDFAPAPLEPRPNHLNLWRGFAVEPAPNEDLARPWREHVRENLCRGDEALFAWVENWLAALVQLPGLRPETAIVLRGGRGTGKGIFARTVGELFHPRHYVHLASRHHLTGHFNAQLEGRVVVYADEAVWGGDKTEEGVLKQLVTEPTVLVERKGLDAYPARNCTHLILSSNNPWVVPAGMDERRFLVLEVSDARARDVDYFGAIVEALDHGGRAALLAHYLAQPVNRRVLRLAPATVGLWHQKIRTMTDIERWWFSRLLEGRLLPADDGWTGEADTGAIHDHYLREVERVGVSRRSMETELGLALRELLSPAGGPWPRRRRRRREGAGRVYLWEFPDLETCRAAFRTKFNLDVDPFTNA